MDQIVFYWVRGGEREIGVCSDDSKYIHTTGKIENLIQKRMLGLCSNQFKNDDTIELRLIEMLLCTQKSESSHFI